MEIGLLWYDGDPARPLEQKVQQAATRYQEKFDRIPNTCYTHPLHVAEQAAGIQIAHHGGQIRVIPAPNILLHHFWIGESVLL